MSTAAYTLDRVRKMSKNREFFIYGAGPRGNVWFDYLKKNGFPVTGFVDRSKTGPSIYRPDLLKEKASGIKPLVIIAAQSKYIGEIMSFLNSAGYVKDVDYINGLEFCDLYPTIEIAGVCNLKCASCNLGTSLGAPRKAGMMKIEMFKRIFDKMRIEIPIMPSISLFCWGEPLLHPHVAEMIRYVRDCGVEVELSTNLNCVKTLEKVIEAGPAFIRVPCSGTGARYERSHTGGKWETFHKNIYLLKSYIDTYKASTKVALVYHVYKDNIQDDFDVIKGIADELGYIFLPIIANIFPESIYNYVVKGMPIPKEMRDISKHMIYSIEEQIAYSRSIHKRCQNIRGFPTVRWDGSVIPCCNMEGGRIAEQYLDVPLTELKRRFETCDHCTQCRKHGIEHVFYVNSKIEEKNGIRTVVKT
jgi:MoaA/NifB/PqqE/SkfB family radical SAM enzyme